MYAVIVEAVSVIYVVNDVCAELLCMLSCCVCCNCSRCCKFKCSLCCNWSGEKLGCDVFGIAINGDVGKRLILTKRVDCINGACYDSSPSSPLATLLETFVLSWMKTNLHPPRHNSSIGSHGQAGCCLCVAPLPFSPRYPDLLAIGCSAAQFLLMPVHFLESKPHHV